MTLVLSTEQLVEASPETVFGLFGQGPGAGWVFDAACDRVRTGAAVTLRVPLFGTAGGAVELLGRITSVRPPSRVEIWHDQPWRGRLRVHIDPAGDRTRVRLVADLVEPGLHWLLRRRGHTVPDPRAAGERRVGLLTSKSGPGSVFATATENLAAMAVEEINADGGIGGRSVRLRVGDDATDPTLGALEARRLVDAGCRTILLTTTSATFARVRRELATTGVLLVHALMNEGGRGDALCVQLGERPDGQLRAAMAPVTAAAQGRRWFLAGNDYIWPRAVHAAARRVLAEHRSTVVGAALTGLGTTDFGAMIERILTSDADIVLSSFVGADLVHFERQCHASGVRARCRSLALALDEPTRERIGDEAAAGMFGSSGYFEQLPGRANAAFLDRYRRAFGPFAAPVSSISESVYEGLHLYAAAARRVGSDEPLAIARELRRSRVELARGPVTVEGPETVHQPLFVAEARAGGFVVHRAG